MTFRERLNSLGSSKSGLVALKIALILLVGVIVWTKWYEQRPLEVYLRDVFRESGFKVPSYVSDLEGEIGSADFQGDYSASLSFTVRPEEIDSFLHLPKIWKVPSAFKPIERDSYCGKFKVRAGSFMLEEWTSSDYQCKYAVDRSANRIYFYRSST